MKPHEFNIGQADVVERFLQEASASPREIRKLVLVSPFVELAGGLGSAGHRLRELLSSVRAAGGEAVLISEDTPTRKAEFRRAMELDCELEGSLRLCKKLHAKCGWALNRAGCNFAFLGSANLTDAGLHKNGEIAFGFKVRGSYGTGYQMLGQIQNVIGRLRATSKQINVRNH
jgi:hypothetical protein